MQERSRETRRRLVRAALQLWSERGFETGIEETTAEEIAQAAGVTKGTFYFHFAHKEEILLEMGYETASVLSEEAARCIKAERPLEDSLRLLMNALARAIKAADPAAVTRALAEFRRPRRSDSETPSFTPAFAEAFEVLFERAQKEGEVTDQVEPAEMAQIVEALVVDSLLEWAGGRLPKLNVSLHRRTAIVLAGLRPDNTLTF
ncbi:TetR/AcrR family transcriptional regulator [Pseudofrankia inefficax]|uniref:Regulatory protein TetR n=1 Tax=Pseudofrankia inefficax (strain DSM 45817 / CECT 9037 / DDB 130130 / EuI1c) TaxID=298654 RepID=E3J882_PSEI1|nr:TetR/AcrR family transcriptional regulator [Pseudofrankia inefficax]ADP83275.1 regulatory protein TetR [Pseudofrankia inefficax]